MVVYWYGTTVEAGASLSERLTQTCATIATMPSSARSTRSRIDDVTQATGDSTAPSTSAATVCDTTSTVSLVPRKVRVAIIDNENVKLPAVDDMEGEKSAVFELFGERDGLAEIGRGSRVVAGCHRGVAEVAERDGQLDAVTAAAHHVETLLPVAPGLLEALGRSQHLCSQC